MDGGIPISDYARAMIDAAKVALSKGKSKRTRHPGERGKVNTARWRMLNNFVDRHMRQLPASAALTWLSLFRHADAKGDVARALTVLARDTGLSLYSVRKGIAALEAAGLLSIRLKGNNYGGQYTVTCYKLLSMR